MFKKFSILKPLLAVLIIFIPLYPKFPLANVTGTYVAIRLEDILIAITMIIWLGYQIKHKFPILKEPITKLLLAYYLAITVSFLNAYLIFQTESTSILLLHLVRRLEYTSLLFLTISAIKNYKDITFYYLFLVITTIAVVLYGYGQKYLQFPVISTMNSEFSKGQLLQMDVWTRISSTFAGHYDLAVYLSVVLIIIGAVVILQKNNLLKILALIFLWYPSYLILTFTASRISIFAFFGAAFISLILIKKYLWLVPLTLVVGISITISGDLNQRLLATLPALKNQLAFLQQSSTTNPILTPIPTIIINNPGKNGVKTTPLATPTPIVRHGQPETWITPDSDAGVARSGEIRFNAEWPRAKTAFNRNILVGSGLGSITLATDNDYLRALGESGLLGFITFFAIFLYFFLKTLPIIFKPKRTYQELIILILFGGLLSMLANAMFIDVFEASKTAYLFWIMMGIYYKILQFNPHNK